MGVAAQSASDAMRGLVRKRYRPYFCLAGVCLLAGLWRMTFNEVPFERDEGGYAYGAWRILEGETLYRDLLNFTPPGVFYLYALAITNACISKMTC